MRDDKEFGETEATTMLAVLIVPLVAVALVLPVLYIFVTWEHEIVQTYGALPAPKDLGTKEFRWRCYLSPLTRRGWRKAILRSPCPRVTLQCPFALVSADFAQLTTSLGFPKPTLEDLPFVFPQVAVSSLFLQLLGNSNFPSSVRDVRLKALTICQLRPLDMRVGNSDESAANPPELHCLMVLTEKRFVEDEIEFTVQTDLFDDAGTLWQSVTWLSIPFRQETLLVPLSTSGATLDAALTECANANALTTSFACSRRNLAEFEDVAVADISGAKTDPNVTPLMWMLGQTAAALQRQERVPTLPLMFNSVFSDEVSSVPVEKKVSVTSWTSGDRDEKPVVKFSVDCDSSNVATGLLRTVGWTYTQEQEQQQEQPDASS